MQFTGQQQCYQDYYTDTAFLVILLDELPVGRLYLASAGPGEIRIVDLALLPDHIQMRGSVHGYLSSRAP